jgi:hypothetical protein
MKENHKIAKYIVSFSQLAPNVQWSEAALQHTFYISAFHHRSRTKSPDIQHQEFETIIAASRQCHDHGWGILPFTVSLFRGLATKRSTFYENCINFELCRI